MWTILNGTCFMSSELCVASPQWPGRYDGEQYCALSTGAGYISATSFHTESHRDFLYIGGQWFHGRDEGPQGIEVWDGDVIEWTSDYSVQRKGWEICIGQDRPEVVGSSSFNVESGSCTARHNCIASTNFPANYPDNDVCPPSRRTPEERCPLRFRHRRER